MNCKSCNAPLSIEAEVCPYCGTPNPDAVQHRRDMKRFTGDFLKTRSSVLNKANANAAKSTRIVLVSIMLILLVASFIFVGLSFDLAYDIPKWRAASHSKEYCEILDTYEANEDYLAFAAFYEENNLYGVDEFDEYQYIYRATSDYQYIFDYIATLLCEERWEGDHESARERLCDQLSYFYENVEREPYEHMIETGAYDQVHLDSVARITEKVEGLLQLTFSFTEEEMEQFKNASVAGKQVMIEGKVNENE